MASEMAVATAFPEIRERPTSIARSAPNLCIALPAGVAARELGGRRIVFSERDGVLYELDPVSFFLVQTATCFPDGVLFDDVLRTGRGAGIPDSAIAAACEELKCRGLLSAFDMAYRISLAIGSGRCDLCLSSKDLYDQTRTLFSALISSDAQQVTARVNVLESGHAYVVSSDGQTDRQCSPRQIIPFIRASLTDVLLRGEFSLAVHAATLSRNGRTIMLAGEPGAGKSTLAIALMGAVGFRVHGDDVALLHESGDAQPIPFPASVKSGSWRLLQNWRPELATDPAHERGDGLAVKFLPLCQRSLHAHTISHVFFIRRRTGAPALVRLDALEVFRRLLAEASGASGRLDVKGFAALQALCRGAQGWEVQYDDLEAAIMAIEKVTANPHAHASPS